MTGEDIRVPSWWRNRSNGSVVRVLRTGMLDQGAYGSVTVLDTDGAERAFSVYAFLSAFEQVPEPARKSPAIGSRWVHKTGGAHVRVTAVDTLMLPHGPTITAVIVSNGLGESRRWDPDKFFACHAPAEPAKKESRWLDPVTVAMGCKVSGTCPMRPCGRCFKYPAQTEHASNRELFGAGLYYRCAFCAQVGAWPERNAHAIKPAVLPQSVLTPVPRWRAAGAWSRPARVASQITRLRERGLHAWEDFVERNGKPRVRKVRATVIGGGKSGDCRWILI